MEKKEFVYTTFIRTTPEKLSEALRGINNGWPAVLSSLKSLLETREPIALTPSC